MIRQQRDVPKSQSQCHRGASYLPGGRSEARSHESWRGSFLSSHDPRMVLGIGKRTKIDWLEVKWQQPSGAAERFTNRPVDRYITIVEGTGKWE